MSLPSHARVPCVCASALLLLASAAAAQWPQWGGPHRNFSADSTGLADSWPSEGPRRLWRRPLGDGYSAISVDDGRLYTMYRRDQGEQKQEVVIALDPATGKTLWEFAYDAPFEKDMDMEFGPGPYATPLVDGDRVVTLGVTAKLHCLNKKTGKVEWSHDLKKEFNASLLGRGVGASAIACNNLVILPVGGNGHSIVAFDAATGAVRWKAQDFDPSYASPLVIRFQGEDQVVVFMGKNVAGLNPADGALLWQHPHETKYDANISTPLWGPDNILFVSSAYGGGSRAIRLTRQDGKIVPKELWHNAKMQMHFGNVVCIGHHVFGSSGDFGPAFFSSVDLRTGEFGYRERGIRKATVVAAGKTLIVLGEDGTLALVEASPSEFKIKSRCELLARNAWTVPTLVDKTLYLRDRKEIMALDLAPPAAPAKSG